MTRLPHAIAFRARRGRLFASTGLAGFAMAGVAASLSFGTPAQAQTLPTG